MKILFITGLCLGCLLSFCNLTFAQDMRALQQEVQQEQQQLEKKAAAEKADADAEAKRSSEKIRSDKAALQAEIARLQSEVKILTTSVATLSKENASLTEQEKEVTAKLSESDSMIKETVGVIRLNTKDLTAMIKENLQSGVNRPSIAFLEAIGNKTQFPGMDDIRQMMDLIFEQLHTGGEVSISQGQITDRAGLRQEADILTVGCFTAYYRLDKEVGFLNYSSAGQNLYSLSRLPEKSMRKQIRGYMNGENEAPPVDISRGAALRQFTHSLSLFQQIPRGGLLVWPILAILCIGVLIVIERVVFLLRKRCDSDRLLLKLEEVLREGGATACQKLQELSWSKPVARVLRAGVLNCKEPRDELENVLQEAILREIPPMERFLATLGMLAAIAPLLGLLGTVTGMIDTFQVITQFGTGDPKLMSGGISVALVTTMLGLAVAIPIMLAHTLLSRSVENQIGQLEEKAVAFVNIVQKYR